ncbi:MAG: hypothetical protein IKD61_05530 [Oscillospiraceae bacterium]|nr:hypothetical protein [Oscillospiraceae bacterium]
MAIITERYTIDGRDYIRTFSDAGRYVVGGSPEGEYSEACDPAELGRTYTEGELMPVEPEDIEVKAEAYDILMGVSE